MSHPVVLRRAVVVLAASLLALPAAVRRGGAQAATIAQATVPVLVDSAPRRPAVALDPNIAGAPNYAGHLATPLEVDLVRSPIEAELAGGSGPEVVHVQVLLTVARFSPGSVSGVWNENTVYALRAFRAAVGLPAGDVVDVATYDRLVRAAGNRDPLRRYVLTAADVRGPYRRLPSSIYAKAKLDCLCYQSLGEMLGERFHTTPDVLRQLNPGVDFARAAAGTALVVPNTDRGAAPAPARLVVDRGAGSMRGLDAKGRTLFWIPVTVGSPREPSPRGRFTITEASPNPRYHYDPLVLGDVPDSRPGAVIAPGPNSPVGVMWAQLSRAHLGIHGTPDPEDIGYTMSHGCVRVANWDARWLMPQLRAGLTVDFL